MNFDRVAYKVQKAVTVATGPASAVVAIPTTAAGTAAKVVRVTCAFANEYCYIMPGQAGTTVAVASGLGIGGASDMYLDVSGCTHIAHIQGSAAANLNIAVVEW